uniref:diguanylate cyclase n=1 Tax=Hylemonella sp. TaxID=2066020 RepID=UPI0035AE7A31
MVSSQGPQGPFPLLSGRKPCLLIVDDQPMNIQIMHRVFAQDCQILMATSGEQALRISAEQQPDLVLLDIEMPGMNGIETCRQLKGSEITREIPVIFVTASTEPEQETQGLEVGAVDFIAKPVNPPVLRARVRTHLLLKQQSDLLRGMAYRDGLTGIYNRRYFDEQLEREWARARRARTEIALLLVDVDDFKAYNDHYGHQAGDRCLKEIGAVLKGSVKRSTDIVARYGGEEFICLLPDTSYEQAQALASRLEQAVRERAIPHQTSRAAPVVTVSIGLAGTAYHDAHPSELVALADQQLYLAKSMGRARVCSDRLSDITQAPGGTLSPSTNRA